MDNLIHKAFILLLAGTAGVFTTMGWNIMGVVMFAGAVYSLNQLVDGRGR